MSERRRKYEGGKSGRVKESVRVNLMKTQQRRNQHLTWRNFLSTYIHRLVNNLIAINGLRDYRDARMPLSPFILRILNCLRILPLYHTITFRVNSHSTTSITPSAVPLCKTTNIMEQLFLSIRYLTRSDYHCHRQGRIQICSWGVRIASAVSAKVLKAWRLITTSGCGERRTFPSQRFLQQLTRNRIHFSLITRFTRGRISYRGIAKKLITTCIFAHEISCFTHQAIANKTFLFPDNELEYFIVDQLTNHLHKVILEFLRHISHVFAAPTSICPYLA